MIKDEYELANKEIKETQLYILAYIRGSMEELHLSYDNSLLKAIKTNIKEKYGFLEPLPFNINKYYRIIEKEYPELDIHKLKFNDIEFIYNKNA